jgi:hypothetical protein
MSYATLFGMLRLVRQMNWQYNKTCVLFLVLITCMVDPTNDAHTNSILQKYTILDLITIKLS